MEQEAPIDSSLMLSEKFTPAALPEVCAPRRSLIGRFDDAAALRFGYVGAPAGSGKTVSTLLWLKACKRKVVWIGLDRYDNAPTVFFKLLATGLLSVQPENVGMRRVLASPSFSASPVEHVIMMLAEMQPPTERYALVLDDVHLVTNREIMKALPAVFKRLPGAFAVLLLSRNELPDELRGVVREPAQLIGADQLRFTEDEIRRYFKSLGRSLTAEESRFAFAATEGWAIGVAAVAKTDKIDSGSSHYLFASYFESQVWNAWDPDLREFCLRTSVVDEFDPELARLLTGRPDARAVMDELNRTNTFLSRLHGDAYRYHHLFQDFLREKAAADGIDRPKLCKAAAAYYREHRDYSRALRFWMESGDYRGIDAYLLLFLFENNRGNIAEYADFLNTFFVDEVPERAFKECPPLHVLGAWHAYLTSRRELFERHMDAVYRNLPRIARADSRFMEYALLAYSVDHRTSILEKVKHFRAFGRFIKRFTPEGLATNIASFTHNLPYMHRSNLDYSDLALEEGSMRKLEGNFSLLLGQEWRYIEPGIPACFAYERNRLDEARAGIERARAAMVPDNKVEGRLCVAVMHQQTLWQLGRTDEADAVLDELDGLVEREAPFFLPNLKAHRAKLSLFDADKRVARTWLDEFFVTEVERVELYRVPQHFTTARAHLALEHRAEALRVLDLLDRFGREFNRPLDVGEAGALKAALLWAYGKKAEACEALSSALEALAPYGFVRIVADEGASVEPVLKRLLKQVSATEYGGPLERAYVHELLLAAHATAQRHPGVTANIVPKKKPVKLSQQQTLVLSLLAQGRCNADIVAETGLSLSTVKSHTAAAYRKLGVHTAMDAVLKARELGLLE